YMVKNPKKLVVKKLPSSFVELLNHPTKDMGKRKVEIDENLYMSSEDATNLSSGTNIRLMGLGNIAITKNNHELEGEFTGDDMNVGYPKFQWIPQKNSHELKIIIPKQLFIDGKFNEDSLEEIIVRTEPYFLELSEGAEIQFVRFGYCRKDSQNQAIFTHK
ncbi:MAG: glutamate--tRNA ligase, partial [Nitrosopumilaceae archaeon]